MTPSKVFWKHLKIGCGVDLKISENYTILLI